MTLMRAAVVLAVLMSVAAAHGQTALDQSPRERALSAAVFANPPTSSVALARPAPVSSPSEAVVPGEIMLKNGSMITGKAIAVIPEKARIQTANGVIEVPLSEIDEGYCKALFPDSATTGMEVFLEGFKATYSELHAAETPSSPAPVPEDQKPLKDGLNIVDFDAKVISSDDNYSTIGWKVDLTNNSDDLMEGIDVLFSFRGKDGIEVTSVRENDVTIKPHETKTVTSTTLLKNSEWDQVDSYHVSTEKP
jgi:hypothetical protein